MTTYETVQIALQSVVLLGIFATLIVYYRQLKAMTAQLDIARHSSTAQNFISVINYLQAEHVRQARTLVLIKLNTKELGSWTDEEKRAASTVCSTYDVAAILLQMGLVPKDAFIPNWGPSIRNCYQVLRPFIDLMQQPDKGGPRYWNDLKWLADEADKALGYDKPESGVSK